MTHIITNVRKHMTSNGKSEITLRQRYEDLHEIWLERQTLLREMNQAKIQAAEAAAQPFQQRLSELDENYATILALLSEVQT